MGEYYQGRTRLRQSKVGMGQSLDTAGAISCKDNGQDETRTYKGLDHGTAGTRQGQEDDFIRAWFEPGRAGYGC